MPRAYLPSLLLLTLASALPAHADEGGLCTSVCATERTRCQKEARSVDRFERDTWVSRQDVRAGSDASAEMERLEARRAEADTRRFERDADCEAAYGRCTAECRPLR
jgi:hypothetical protein